MILKKDSEQPIEADQSAAEVPVAAVDETVGVEVPEQAVEALEADVSTEDEALVKQYTEALTELHGDKTEDLLNGYRSLSGLTLMMIMSALECEITYPISGVELYQAYKHYHKVLNLE